MTDRDDGRESLDRASPPCNPIYKEQQHDHRKAIP
jgi:hypothetical protein